MSLYDYLFDTPEQYEDARDACIAILPLLLLLLGSIVLFRVQWFKPRRRRKRKERTS